MRKVNNLPPTNEPLRDLIDRVDLRDLVAATEGQGQRSGKARLYYAPPWRASQHKSRSLAVYADGFKDWSTGESGGVLDWIERAYNLTRPDAIQWLREYVNGHAAPQPRQQPEAATAESEPPSALWQQSAAAVIREAERYLWSDRADARRVLTYLHAQRGLSDETIRRYHLGYNPAWKKLVNGRLAPGITLPYYVDGALWALRVRCRVGSFAQALGIAPDRQRDGNELSKYLNLAGSKVSGALFNGDAIQSDVLFVEGEFDAMIAQQELGDSVAVVTLGSASNRLTARWQARLKGTIYLALDADEAGRAAAAKLRAALPAAIPLPLPAGKDITEFAVDQHGDLSAWWQNRRASVQIVPLYYHANGTPRSWLKAVCIAFPGSRTVPKLALLWFEALRRHLIDPEDFTVNQLIAARDALGVNLTNSSLRGALKLTGGLFQEFYKSDRTSPDIEITSVDRGGHPEDHYRALPLTHIEAALPRWTTHRIEEARHHERGTTPNLTAAMIESLDGDARAAALSIVNHQPPMSDQAKTTAWLARRDNAELVQSLKDLESVVVPLDCADLRATLFNLENNPDEARSCKQIARAYGLSSGGVAALVKRAGLQAEEQSAQYPIRSLDTLETDVALACKTKHGYPRALVEVQRSGEIVEYAYRPSDPAANHAVAEAAYQAGSRLEIEVQTASKYHPIDPEDPPVPPPKRRFPHAQRRPAARAPIRPYYGEGYNPSMVRHWLKTHLRRFQWRELSAQRFVDPASGELFDLREADFFA